MSLWDAGGGDVGDVLHWRVGLERAFQCCLILHSSIQCSWFLNFWSWPYGVCLKLPQLGWGSPGGWQKRQGWGWGDTLRSRLGLCDCFSPSPRWQTGRRRREKPFCDELSGRRDAVRAPRTGRRWPSRREGGRRERARTPGGHLAGAAAAGGAARAAGRRTPTRWREGARGRRRRERPAPLRAPPPVRRRPALPARRSAGRFQQ